MGNSKKNSVLLIFAFLAVFYSCDRNRVFEQTIDIPGSNWHKDSIVFFNVDISDTLSAHAVNINLRHDSEYPKRNIYLFINTHAPTGHAIRDTFEIILADEKGKWYGSGLGGVWDIQKPFKHNVRFPISGTYRFEMEQAMRYDELPNIRSIGLRIETIE